MDGQIKMASSSVATTLVFKCIDINVEDDKDHEHYEELRRLRRDIFFGELRGTQLRRIEYNLTINEMIQRRKTTTTILFNKLPLDIIRLIFQYEEEKCRTCDDVGKICGDKILFNDTYRLLKNGEIITTSPRNRMRRWDWCKICDVLENTICSVCSKIYSKYDCGYFEGDSGMCCEECYITNYQDEDEYDSDSE